MAFGNIIQSTRNKLSGARTFLNGSQSAFLSPVSAKGISGWEFDIPGSESVTLSSDITDHFTENNSFINDHIVHKPIRITLSGFIGEKVFRRPGGIVGDINELNNRLDTVEAYLGQYTPGFIQAAGQVFDQAEKTAAQINNVIDKTENVVSLLSSPFSQERTAIQKAYIELYSLWVQKQLVTVQTPFNYFTDMIIETITFSQDEDTLEMIDISITIKEFRVAKLQTFQADESLFAPRVDVQKSEESDQGIVKGNDTNDSALFSIIGEFSQ